jgi:PKHD-type hydroxylase
MEQSERSLFTDDRSYDHLGWLALSERLSDADCDAIIELGAEYTLSEPTVVGDERLLRHRVGDVHKVPRDGRSASLYELLWNAAVVANAAFYRLRISGISREIQYVEYAAGKGHFHWHNDYSHERETTPRKLTVIVQLSHADDYRGGDLQVFDVEPEALPRERGTIIILPSFSVHRVTPVTRGVRRVIVGWIAGPRLE